MSQTVVLLGASDKPERYAYKALAELIKKGHKVIPINPVLEKTQGIKVVKTLGEITSSVDTLTLYVGPQRLIPMIPDIIKLKPSRIISNPGTETDALKKATQINGIEYIEACTLVMLATEQF